MLLNFIPWRAGVSGEDLQETKHNTKKTRILYIY